jgi:NADH-quinone oxidoreductase subunit C
MSEKQKERAAAPWVSDPDTAARLLAARVGEACRVEQEQMDPAVTLPADQWRTTALWLRDELAFETCHLVTGIDRGPEQGRLEVLYHLFSRNRGEWLHVRIELPRPGDGTLPEVDSVADIWRAADWHERETYDLVGIRFRNHPDLRRMLLPEDWKGHPLRKDYTYPLEYHGIPDVYRMPGSLLYEEPSKAVDASGGEA